jgi:D-alanyl-D-alanine carboxypeptidase
MTDYRHPAMQHISPKLGLRRGENISVEDAILALITARE